MSNKEIPFKINSIVTEEFATIPKALKDGEDVNIATSFSFGMNKANNAIAVLIDLSYECQSSPFIKLKLNMAFEVESDTFANFKKSKEGKITVPKSFLIHLAAMTVSTARGVLHTRLASTDLEHFILPALNVSDILETDLVFD